jgi:hypothetical protein
MALEQRVKRWRYVFHLIVCLSLATTWLTGCAVLFPHDPTTHENLIELKAEAVTLVETFDTNPFDRNEAALADLTLKFQKAYVYEKGKVKRNSDTMRKLDAIWSLLTEDIAAYRENGNAPLVPMHFHEAAVILGQAFDTALAIEKVK